MFCLQFCVFLSSVEVTSSLIVPCFLFFVFCFSFPCNFSPYPSNILVGIFSMDNEYVVTWVPRLFFFQLYEIKPMTTWTGEEHGNNMPLWLLYWVYTCWPHFLYQRRKKIATKLVMWSIHYLSIVCFFISHPSFNFHLKKSQKYGTNVTSMWHYVNKKLLNGKISGGCLRCNQHHMQS